MALNMHETNIIDTETLKVALTFNDDVRKDFDGLVCIMADIGKRHPMLDNSPKVRTAEEKILYFIANHVGMWEDTGRQGMLEYGRQNHDITFNDRHFGENVLKAFKAYERLWASRKHEGSNEANWDKMQVELLRYIDSWAPQDKIYY
ncbi:MAG: hypothetical protein ABIH72_02990 [archaeon]